MKRKYFALLILLSASLLALPNLTKASTDINLKEVILSSTVNTPQNSFTATAGATELLVTYTTSTKVSGLPKEITYADWLVGDKLAITGQIVGYENNKLKIQAQTIKYDFSKHQVKNVMGFVNNVDATNHKIWITFKDKNQYTTQEITKVNEPDGPRLVSFASFDEVTLGTAVTINQIWNKTPSAPIKTIAITKLIKNENLQVITIKRSGTTFSLETGVPTVTKLKRGQKFTIQNKTGINLYFSTSGESSKFSPKPGNGYMLIKSDSSVSYAVNPTALVGPVNLLFKKDLIETAATVITVQLEIIIN